MSLGITKFDICGQIYLFRVKSTIFWNRHPPKKYHSHPLDTIPPTRRGRLIEETQPDRYGNESTETVGDRRISGRNRDVSGNRTNIRQPIQVSSSRQGVVPRR